MDETAVKVASTGILAVLAARFTILLVPMLILALMNLFDMGTGLIAAPYRGEQRKASRLLEGLIKKVMLWMLVFIGVAVDFLIQYSAQSVGIVLPLNCLMASIVIIWLICNEIISILENVGDIGIEVPSFLRKVIEWMKKSAEEKADITKGGA